MYEILNILNEYEDDIGIIIVTRMKMLLKDLETGDIFYAIVTFFQKIDTYDIKIGSHILQTNKIKITKEVVSNVE